MIIGVNTRFLLKNKLEGFGWFTFETFSRIVKKNPEHTFIFFFDRKYDASFIFAKNVVPVILYPPTRHIKIFDFWFNVRLSKALKKYKCDAFIAPDGFLSLKTNIPQLAVIHDLNFEHFPEDLPKNVTKYYTSHFPIFANKAARIVTVSNFSKMDIVERYNVAPKKIDVVYNGVADRFKPLSKKKVYDIRKAYSKGEPYILFVGAIHKRKNLDRLIKAFERVKNNYKKPVKLLIVGEELWKNKSNNTSLNKDIIYIGRLNSEELSKVYAAAMIFTYVSYFEGFGIPILESMKSGVPVLAGNRTSLPEVGGDAAHYCDPFSEESIAEEILFLLNNENIRTELINKGLKRSAFFSWENTADGLWRSFLNMMENQP